ncbi:hypothetical protein HPP92_028173 [Vanilla planifolia]|uniref:MEKHLA domain-containing protein n=1 Tax=Vanilla planifolia TaxID=51239 RepID=A0A835P8Z0_VANPL|nr:hypothetical protein HPP92_028173 [Vanilla planifolia]
MIYNSERSLIQSNLKAGNDLTMNLHSTSKIARLLHLNGMQTLNGFVSAFNKQDCTSPASYGMQKLGRIHTGAELFRCEPQVGDSLLKLLWHYPEAIMCCTLRASPVFLFANQAGLDLLETTLVALQDITLEKILDDGGRKLFCSEFSKIMQQGFAYLPGGVCLSSMGRPVSYDQIVVWKVLDEEDAHHCLAFMFVNWSFCVKEVAVYVKARKWLQTSNPNLSIHWGLKSLLRSHSMSGPSLSPLLAHGGVLGGRERMMASAEQLVLDICDPELRENALLELSKKREIFQDLAPLLWNSYGTITALLQEIVSIYPFLSPPTLSPGASNRVCNALALLQVDDREVISFLLTTEIVPYAYVQWKTVVSYQRHNLCAWNHGRFACRATIDEVFKHIIRCYLRLTDYQRGCIALQERLPKMLKDGSFNGFLDEPTTCLWLQQLLINVYGDIRGAALNGGLD